MGCGHSKINIYSRKSKGKHSSKKSGNNANSNELNGDSTNQGSDSQSNGKIQAEKHEFREEAAAGDTNEIIGLQDTEETDSVKKLRAHVGGPLSAHSEISHSQQNFFRMLDEKIENGPDYDPSSDLEKFKENQRLNSLLQDWETASATSRSLPSTPKHQPQQQAAYHSSKNIAYEQYYQQYYLPRGPTIQSPPQQNSPKYQPPPQYYQQHYYQQYSSPTHQQIRQIPPQHFHVVAPQPPRRQTPELIMHKSGRVPPPHQKYNNVVISKMGNTSGLAMYSPPPIVKSTNEIRATTGTDPMSPKLNYRKQMEYDVT